MSPRLGAPRYANADEANFATQVSAVTDAIDANAGLYAQGTMVLRPTATTARKGMIYDVVGDTALENGRVYRCTGSTWDELTVQRSVEPKLKTLRGIVTSTGEQKAGTARLDVEPGHAWALQGHVRSAVRIAPLRS